MVSPSLSTVFFTVTLSDVVTVSLPRLPLNNATNSKIKTAAPTIHTQGCVYHPCEPSVEIFTSVVFVEDVVVFESLPPLPSVFSWAQTAKEKRDRKQRRKKERTLNSVCCFMATIICLSNMN